MARQPACSSMNSAKLFHQFCPFVQCRFCGEKIAHIVKLFLSGKDITLVFHTLHRVNEILTGRGLAQFSA